MRFFYCSDLHVESRFGRTAPPGSPNTPTDIKGLENWLSWYFRSVRPAEMGGRVSSPPPVSELENRPEREDSGERDEGEILLLAGDLCPMNLHPESIWRVTLSWISARFRRVILVLGNHEWYGIDIREEDSFLRDMTQDLPENVVLLRKGSVWMDPRRKVAVIGGTLWYAANPMNPLLYSSIADFSLIRADSPSHVERWAVRQGNEHLNRLREALIPGGKFSIPSDVRIICLTHHLPLSQSVHPSWRGSRLNTFFLNSDVVHVLRDVVGRYHGRLPDIWVHGHTHQPCDYTWRGMRVLCNPMGYPTDSGCESGSNGVASFNI